MSLLDISQLQYLKNVLGLERILVPEISEIEVVAHVRPNVRTSAPELLNSAKFVALFPLEARDFPLRDEAASLVEKMIAAMKVKQSEVFYVEYEGDELPEFDFAGKIVVAFGDVDAKRKGEWFPLRGSRAIATHSPRELLEAPEKKRLAWVHLQIVMKEL